jgi:hypothetical protein
MRQRWSAARPPTFSRVADDYNLPPRFCLTFEFFDRVEAERPNFAEGRRPALPPALLQLLANAYEMLAARCGDALAIARFSVLRGGAPGRIRTCDPRLRSIPSRPRRR